MKLRAGLIIGALLLGLGTTNTAQAVTFGQEVTNASTVYPSVLSIWYKETLKEEPRFICTGTAIKPDVVLTAAHCVLNVGFYYVKFGADQLGEETDLIRVSATWKNPKYSASQGVNDIGLLRLESALPSNAVTNLPTSKQILSVQANKKTKYEIVGWGINQNSEEATYIRKAAVDDQSSYMKKFKGWRNDVWLAVGKYNSKEKVFAGSCNGDSGGPLFATLNGNRTLVGVTSWGAEDCETIAPSVYVRLSYYIDTINKVGMPTLSANQSNFNRLPPSFDIQPSITLTENNGYLLTCNYRGSEKTSSKVSWESTDWKLSDIHSESVLLQPGTQAAKVKCVVEISNPNGTIKSESTIDIPAGPQVSNTPKLSSMPASLALDGTNVVTCTPASGNGFTNAKTSLWVSSSSYFDSAKSTKVAEGTSITLSKGFLEQNGGKYLYCQTELTSNVSKQISTSTSTVIPEIKKVVLDSYNLSIGGTASLSTYYAPFLGETVDCSATYSSYGDRITANYQVLWLTGTTSDPSLATELSRTNPLVITSEIRNAVRGKYLFCKYSYTNLAGTSIGFKGQAIGKDLPPYSVTIDIQGVSEFTDLTVGTQVKCAYSPAKGSTVERVFFNSLSGFNLEQSSFTVTQDILNSLVGQKLTCNVQVSNGESGGTFSSSVLVRGVRVVAPVIAPAPVAPVAPTLTCVRLKNSAVDQSSKTACTTLISAGINVNTHAMDSTITLNGNIAQVSYSLTPAPGDDIYTNWYVSSSSVDKNNFDANTTMRLPVLNPQPSNPYTLTDANLQSLKGKYLVAVTWYLIQGQWILDTNGLSVLPPYSVDSVLIP